MDQNTANIFQATGPPRSGAGVGIDMLRGAGDSHHLKTKVCIRKLPRESSMRVPKLTHPSAAVKRQPGSEHFFLSGSLLRVLSTGAVGSPNSGSLGKLRKPLKMF